MNNGPIAVRQQGYVLLMTLVFIVVITLVVGYFSHKVDQALEIIATAKNKADASLSLHSELNKLLYRLSVVRATFKGIGKAPDVMRVDGRPYGDGSTWVQLRDQRGLISLRYPDRARMDRLLGEFNIPVDERSILFDSLEDYIDSDNLRRINGAEAPQYQARRMAPPSNRPLRTVAELRHVYAWADQNRLLSDPDFLELFTTMPVTGINPNAAPPEVLATLPRIDRQIAKQLVGYRQQQPITQAILAKLTGLTFLQMQFLVFPFPSKYFRVTLSCSCPHPVMEYNVALSPRSNLAPWHFESVGQLDARPPFKHAPPIPKVAPFEPAAAGAFRP